MTGICVYLMGRLGTLFMFLGLGIILRYYIDGGTIICFSV